MDFLFGQNNSNDILDIILFESDQQKKQKQIEIEYNKIRNKFISDNTKNRYLSINNYPNNKTVGNYPNNKIVGNYPNNKNIEKLKEEYTKKFLINEDSSIYNDYEEEIIFDKSQNKWILRKSNF